MGVHIIDGEFQSDKYPTCPRGKVPLSIKDTTAQDLIWAYAQRHRAVDAEFADDLETCLRSEGFEPSAALDCRGSDEGLYNLERAVLDHPDIGHDDTVNIIALIAEVRCHRTARAADTKQARRAVRDALHGGEMTSTLERLDGALDPIVDRSSEQLAKNPGPCTITAHCYDAGSATCQCGKATRTGECHGWKVESRLYSAQIREALGATTTSEHRQLSRREVDIIAATLRHAGEPVYAELFLSAHRSAS